MRKSNQCNRTELVRHIAGDANAPIGRAWLCLCDEESAAMTASQPVATVKLRRVMRLAASRMLRRCSCTASAPRMCATLTYPARLRQTLDYILVHLGPGAELLACPTKDGVGQRVSVKQGGLSLIWSYDVM